MASYRFAFFLSVCLRLLVFLVFAAAHSAHALSPSPIPATSPFALAPFITEGVSKPVFLTHAGDGSSRLFVVEQDGRILLVTHGRLLSAPFLDLSSLVSTGGERGLLGLAFHPRYRDNGRFFVNYTRKGDGATVVAEYLVSSDRDRAGQTGRTLLVIPQPYGNHNGGMVAFGPDGYLYVGMGDGGAGGDPGNRAQRLTELLGKILRLDVDRGSPYQVPPDNPFVKGQGRPEIFALGFRNPWRFSFDRKTGTLWVGDVGQNAWEEIDRVAAGDNHGWRLMEGFHCFNPPTGCQTHVTLTLPVTEYANRSPRCAVTGGYVYRGARLPALQGTYLFADFCSGEIFGLRGDAHTVLMDTELQIPSFGEDEDGELYVLGYGGTIYRLIEK